jgi:hypothetical protein
MSATLPFGSTMIDSPGKLPVDGQGLVSYVSMTLLSEEVGGRMSRDRPPKMDL